MRKIGAHVIPIEKSLLGTEGKAKVLTQNLKKRVKNNKLKISFSLLDKTIVMQHYFAPKNFLNECLQKMPDLLGPFV